MSILKKREEGVLKDAKNYITIRRIGLSIMFTKN